MSTGVGPAPETTLALIFGASRWQYAPKFEDAPSFERSADALFSFLEEPSGLGLPVRNIKTFFNSLDDAAEQLEQAGSFIERHRKETTGNDQSPRDLLVFYVGHGDFEGEAKDFYLSVRRTQERRPLITSITARELGNLIRHSASDLRSYLIIDCCFAAAIQHGFMTSPLGLAELKLHEALPRASLGSDEIIGDLPASGVALLASAGPNKPALAPSGYPLTAFTTALLDVLKNGHARLGPRLSLQDIHLLVERRVSELFPDAARPEMRPLHQSRGRVELVAFFPNPAFQGVQNARRREAEEAARLAQEQRRADQAPRPAEETRKGDEVARLAEEKHKANEAAKQADEQRPADISAQRNEVFVSYSHQDERWLRQLRVVLAPLIRTRTIEIWDDTRIDPGSKWRDEIRTALERAKVAVLLLSPDFLNSDFISTNELPPLLAAAKIAGLTIIWIPVRPSLVARTSIIEYQAAVSPARPLSMMRPAERETAFVRIAEAIAVAAESVPRPKIRQEEDVVRRKEEVQIEEASWQAEERKADEAARFAKERRQAVEGAGLAKDKREAETANAQANTPVAEENARQGKGSANARSDPDIPLRQAARSLLDALDNANSQKDLPRRDALLAELFDLADSDLARRDPLLEELGDLAAQAPNDAAGRAWLASALSRSQLAARREEGEPKADEATRLGEEQHKADDATRVARERPAQERPRREAAEPEKVTIQAEGMRNLEGQPHPVNAVAIVADGWRVLAGSNDGTLKLWDLKRGEELHNFEGHTDSVNAVVAFASGRRALSGSDDCSLKLWDLERGRDLHTFKGHLTAISALAVSEDGRRGLSGSHSGTLKLWDLEKGLVLESNRYGHRYRVSALAVFADGRRALSGAFDGRLKLWDLEAWRELSTYYGHRFGVTAIAVFADGRRALSGSEDTTLKLWDLDTGKELLTLEGHTSTIRAVAVFAGGRRALSGSEDTTLKLWDLETGAALATFTVGASVIAVTAAAPDRVVAASSDGRLHILRLLM
jgi:WD40 repeat protein